MESAYNYVCEDCGYTALEREPHRCVNGWVPPPPDPALISWSGPDRILLVDYLVLGAAFLVLLVMFAVAVYTLAREIA